MKTYQVTAARYGQQLPTFRFDASSALEALNKAHDIIGGGITQLDIQEI